MPSTGIPTVFKKPTALRESSSATACPVVTTTAPVISGMSWQMVSGSSPVPGGASITSTSRSPHFTSERNCLSTPSFSGPRQMSGVSPSFMMEPMEIIFRPGAASRGSISWPSEACALPSAPVMRATEGP